MSNQRLDKTLSARGFGSRKEIAALARTGQVKVNGQAARDASVKIDTDSDEITVRGAPVDLREHIYIMLHKPQGVISAARDPRAATVLDLLPQALRRRGLFPVGRLDKDTTGLLLITDDGTLAHELLSPRRHVPKTYLATLREDAARQDVTAFAAGLRLPPVEDRPAEHCLPAQLLPLEGKHARVILHEGKYHQVKRMFAALGNEVLALHRESMGPLALDDHLLPGQCRELTGEEMDLLRFL